MSVASPSVIKARMGAGLKWPLGRVAGWTYDRLLYSVESCLCSDSRGPHGQGFLGWIELQLIPFPVCGLGKLLGLSVLLPSWLKRRGGSPNAETAGRLREC